MERLVNFVLFGQEYSFYTDASEEDVDKVITMVRGELEAGTVGNRSNIPTSKLLVLGCLRIAARYIELDKEYKKFRRNQGVSIDKLIDKVAAGIE